MHPDGTATAGREGIPHDWQRLVDEITWDSLVARLHDVELAGIASMQQAGADGNHR